MSTTELGSEPHSIVLYLPIILAIFNTLVLLRYASSLSCSDSVELKLGLAEQWNKVLLARLRVKLTQKACDAVKKLTRKGERGEGEGKR